MALGVPVGAAAPVPVPARVHEHGPARQVEPGQGRGADLLADGAVDEDPGHVGDPRRVEPGQVVAVGEAVEGGVQVGARVRHHVDAPDLELVAGRVALVGRLPAEVVGDGGPRQPRVGDGAVGEDVAQVDDGHACGLPDRSGVSHAQYES